MRNRRISSRRRFSFILLGLSVLSVAFLGVLVLNSESAVQKIQQQRAQEGTEGTEKTYVAFGQEARYS